MRTLGYRRREGRDGLLGFVGRGSSIGFNAPLPKRVDLTPWAPTEILDQGWTGSCVGHARALQMYVAERFLGGLNELYSPAHLYRVARCYERSDWSEPLQDMGCDPVDSIRGVEAVGCPPMVPLAWRYSDADPATINDPPTLAALIEGKNRIQGSHRFIDAGGEAKVEECMLHLSEGRPIAFDVDAGGKAWQDYQSGVLTRTDSWTNHYVCLLGYEVLDSGDVVFLGQNSWGKWWGEGGRFRCDESVILQARDPIVYFP